MLKGSGVMEPQREGKEAVLRGGGMEKGGPSTEGETEAARRDRKERRMEEDGKGEEKLVIKEKRELEG